MIIPVKEPTFYFFKGSDLLCAFSEDGSHLSKDMSVCVHENKVGLSFCKKGLTPNFLWIVGFNGCGQ